MKRPAFLSSAVDAIRNFRPSRSLFKRFGYSTLFSVLFSFFLFISIPLNRFIPSLEQFLTSTLDRTVQIADISTSLTGALVISGLEIGLSESDEKEPSDTEEAGADDASEAAAKPPVSPMYLFDEVKVNVGMLAALFGKLSVDSTIEGLGGTMEISYEGGFPKKGKAVEKKKKGRSSRKSKSKSRKRKSSRKSATAVDDEDEDEDEGEDGEDAEEEEDEEAAEDVPVSISIKAENLNLKLVHDIRAALPVPLSGRLNMEMALESPTSRFDSASGTLSFVLSDVILSRKSFEAEIFGSKLAVPPLVIASLEGEIVFKEGKGKVTKFKVVSKHLDVTLSGDIELADPIGKSQTDLYVSFKVKDAYLGRSAAIRTIVDSADMFSPQMRRAHRDDGYWGFRYRGTMGKARFSPSKTDPHDSKRSAKSSRSSKRKRRSRSSRASTPPPSRPQISRNDHAPPPMAAPPAGPAVPPSAPPPSPLPPGLKAPPGPPVGHKINRASAGPRRRPGAEVDEEVGEPPEEDEEEVADEEGEEEVADEEGEEEVEDEDEAEIAEEEGEAEEEEGEAEDEGEDEDEAEDEDEGDEAPRDPVDPDDIY